MTRTKVPVGEPPDWEAIRGLYEHAGMPLTALARICGTTPEALRKRAEGEGWFRAGTGSPVGGTRRSGYRALSRKALITRLLRMVDQNLTLMERRMESEEPGTAADRERDTRAIGALTRAIGKITELQADNASGRSAASRSGRAACDDASEAERLRLEIAERILKLRERRDP